MYWRLILTKKPRRNQDAEAQKRWGGAVNLELAKREWYELSLFATRYRYCTVLAGVEVSCLSPLKSSLMYAHMVPLVQVELVRGGSWWSHHFHKGWKKSGEGWGGKKQTTLAGLALRKNHRAPLAQLCWGEVMDPGTDTWQCLQRRCTGTESWLMCYLCLN